MEKKIAESINIRIVPRKFEHIEITKYAERTITFENEAKMIEKEDALTQELLDNIIRNMRTIPERLGKTTNVIPEFEESLSKKIPEWLAEGPIPNMIPNGAMKQAKKLDHNNRAEIEGSTIVVEGVTEGASSGSDDIFETSVEGAESSESPEVLADMEKIVPQEKEAPKEKLKKEEKSNLGDIFGDDDDLFG